MTTDIIRIIEETRKEFPPLANGEVNSIESAMAISRYEAKQCRIFVDTCMEKIYGSENQFETQSDSYISRFTRYIIKFFA